MPRLPRALLAVAAGLAALPTARAQPKPPAVPPTYPTLTTPPTLGGKPGEKLELTLTGTNLGGATGVWLSVPAKVTVPPNQKDAAKLAVTVELPADAPVGVHTLRVGTAAGVSNARPFVVDDLPAVAEADKNKARGTPQPVTAPAVVVGKAEPESSDFFKLPVKAGEPVTIEVLARRLGSPLDPVVLLSDPAGRDLAGVYADDTPGLQADARVVFTPKTTGEVVVEVRDSTYRGGNDYGYRLRVGNFPGVTTAFPVAVERGKTAPIGFAGPGADALKPVTVAAPTDPAVPVVYATPRGASGPAGWPVPVRVSPFPEAVEQEPNDEPAKANKLPVPGGVSARFATKRDVDCFAFPGKKGQKLTVQALTHELNAPTEVYLRVLDAKGAELGKSNPQQPGARVEFTPAADGEFVAVCEHLNYQHGPSEVYHLSVVPAAPDFAVTLGLDRADVPAGAVGVVPVVGVTRANGFADAIELTFAGADGVTGSLTVPPGANPQPTAPLFLPLTAKPGTKPGPVVGHVRAAAKDLVRVATLPDVARAAFGGLGNPPAEVSTQVAVGVGPPPPFTVAVKLEKPEVPKGGSVKGIVTVTRTDGFAEEVAVTLAAGPANVTAKAKPVAKGGTSTEVEFAAAGNAAVGPGAVLVRGTAKLGGKDVGVTALPVAVTIVEAGKK